MCEVKQRERERKKERETAHRRDREEKRKRRKEKNLIPAAIDNRIVSFEWIETMMLGSTNPSAFLLSGNNQSMLHDESFSDDNGKTWTMIKAFMK